MRILIQARNDGEHFLGCDKRRALCAADGFRPIQIFEPVRPPLALSKRGGWNLDAVEPENLRGVPSVTSAVSLRFDLPRTE